MPGQPSYSRAMPSVSAIVVCYNEEERIGECLESLRWCDEIVVVDSFSTDRTPEICRRFTDRFIQREWAGYRDQKAFAHSQATGEWVLLADADERVTPELREEIQFCLAEDNGTYAGYAVPRLVHYLDRWWRRGGWYPDYDVRLFRRDSATWGGADPHEKILVNGKIRRLKNPLNHYSYRNIEDHVRRINRFTSIASREAPIISTPNFFSTPSRARSSAQLSAVCPPIVGSSASGRSFSMIAATICQVIGSM